MRNEFIEMLPMPGTVLSRRVVNHRGGIEVVMRECGNACSKLGSWPISRLASWKPHHRKSLWSVPVFRHSSFCFPLSCPLFLLSCFFLSLFFFLFSFPFILFLVSSFLLLPFSVWSLSFFHKFVWWIYWYQRSLAHTDSFHCLTLP